MNRKDFMAGVDKYRKIIKQAVQVISSSISDVEYEVGSKVMTVKFKNGRTYEYANVPREVFQELLTSDSKGRFFNQNIRDNYTFKETT